MNSIKEKCLVLKAKNKHMGYKKIAKLLGVTPSAVRYHLHPHGKRDVLNRSSKNRRTNKDAIRAVFGSKCVRCGYEKCGAALAFHHIDPEGKIDGVMNLMRMGGKEAALKEAKKCVLLCANCHFELHDNMWNIGELSGGDGGSRTPKAVAF